MIHGCGGDAGLTDNGAKVRSNCWMRMSEDEQMRKLHIHHGAMRGVAEAPTVI